jgi:plasmid stability protein
MERCLQNEIVCYYIDIREAPMPSILIRDLDADILEKLKKSAQRHGRSLQSEAKGILVEAAERSEHDIRRISEKWILRLSGRKHSDSSDLLRQDRER